jgi:hypothetical protein
VAIFNSCGFFIYSGKLLSQTISYLRQKGRIHGESMHAFVLTSSPPISIKRINTCYGVFRRTSCSWSNYGDRDCLRLKKKPPRLALALPRNLLCENPQHYKKVISRLQIDCTRELVIVGSISSNSYEKVLDVLTNILYAFSIHKRIKIEHELSHRLEISQISASSCLPTKFNSTIKSNWRVSLHHLERQKVFKENFNGNSSLNAVFNFIFKPQNIYFDGILKATYCEVNASRILFFNQQRKEISFDLKKFKYSPFEEALVLLQLCEKVKYINCHEESFNCRIFTRKKVIPLRDPFISTL